MTQKKESAGLRFLYRTVPGRILLRPLRSRTLSRLCGVFLDSPLSKPLIKPFLKKNQIDLSEYESETYRCFNDCFTRRIKPELRPFAPEPDVLAAPCDGFVSVYSIDGQRVIPVKQSSYTVASLLNNNDLAARYAGGYCVVFRLCVNHYHRYAFPADGTKEESVFLPGTLHTVRPVALEQTPVFTENCREYTVLHTDRFGTVTQVEVGAMLVGKIKNHTLPPRIKKGQEKGMFLYGGSTVLLLLEAGKVDLPEEWLQKTEQGEEIPIKAGQKIGTACR